MVIEDIHQIFHLKTISFQCFKSTLAVFFALFYAVSGFGQNPSGLHIRSAADPIVIDGVLDEATWKLAEKATHFVNQFPFDTGVATRQTEVMISYDAKNLYVAAVCFDDPGDDQVVWNLRRDFALKTNDNFSVIIDPYNDGANGFNFAVTPLGTQREALILNGDQSFVIWDNKWFSEVKKMQDRWVVELAIPFKTLRFNAGLDAWRVNFSRTDVSNNEISTWVRIPRNYPLTVLSLSAPMFWDKPLEKAGGNLTLIPYAAFNANKNHYPVDQPLKTKAEVGGDAKIAVTSSLNLDVTINPDFSNVEVDQQVTNLSRFEIFFPEQRQFFNENSDLFSQAGFTRIRPFFSRRIGLIKNANAPGYLPTRIVYGARLSGKLNPKLRIGLLNVQTAEQKSIGADATNFTVATFQQKVFGRSNIAGMFVNKQVFKNDSGDFSFRKNVFNRVLGLDYNLLSKNNRWTGKFFYHQSFENQKKTDDFAHAAYLTYNVPAFTLTWNHEWVGKEYNPELGYLQRPKGYFRIEPSATYRHYLSGSSINYVSSSFYNDSYFDRNGKVTDLLYQSNNSLVLKSTAAFTVSYARAYTRLYLGGFDPTNSGSKKLDSNSVYWYQYAAASFVTDTRKRVSASVATQYGQYLNGWLFTTDGFVALRSGSWANWYINYNFNRFWFPDPYPDNQFLLIGPKAELSFSKSQFFTFFLQYNQQAKNININARYQWRFAPMSDLFVVYSENYLPEPWHTKNRGLVVKLVYWVNG